MNYSVIIPSARPANLISCVRALRTNEPDLPPERILIVDDGARAQAEAELPGIRWIDGIKPFVFARNVNRGLQHVDTDVILLNDDAHLATPNGLTQLVAMARQRGKIGICSAGVRGLVANRNQLARRSPSWRGEHDMLAFVCVYLAREAIAQIGLFDEQFVGYGFEDNDYCRRAVAAGFQLAVWDGCVVDHDKAGSSTFRSRGDYRALLDANRKLFERKWSRGLPGVVAPPQGARHAAAAVERPSFVGAMRIKNEAPHIGEVINSILPLCQRVLVLDDHSSDETAAICRSFGERIFLHSSEFQGLDEARDKNFLLGKVVSADPDWVLWIDGDEILERSGPEALRAAAKRTSGPAAYSLRIAYVWDKPEQIRVDGIYGRFRRPSLFRLQGQRTSALHFPATGFGGNLHCGNVPRGLVGGTGDLEVRLKHLGYMDRARRQEKYELYNRIDPNNGREDCYRHLIGIRGARHAPGPPQFAAWSE